MKCESGEHINLFILEIVFNFVAHCESNGMKWWFQRPLTPSNLRGGIVKRMNDLKIDDYETD